MAFDLTPEQKKAVENRGGTLLVSAAAGSGKTRVLVERLMDYVNQGHDIDEFLVITFTNAAAAELRGRISKELGERLARDPQNGRLRRQSTLVYKAKICTIDALCIDILRECGYLAGVDPDFRICDESEGAARRAAAMETVLEARYANIDSDPGFRDLAETLAGDRDDQTLADVVANLYDRVQTQPDPAAWLKARQADFDLPADAKPEDTPWGKLLLEDAARTAEYWADTLSEIRDEAALDAAVDANYGQGLDVTVLDLNDFAAACRTGWDEAARSQVRFPTAGRKKGGDVELRERIKDLRQRCKKQLGVLDERLYVPAAGVMEDLRALRPAMSALLEVVGEFDAAYRAEKTERLLDFSDAAHKTVELLTDKAGNPTALALEWRERFTEIMVDEYQDTNEVQNVLFQALSRDGKNLFLVGDVKQSIYRFRLADPGIFLEKYRTYPPAEQAGDGDPRALVLSRNFRSRPEVLDGVNFLFRGIMSEEFGELNYTAAEALYPGREDAAFDPAFQVELDAVDVSHVDHADEEGDQSPKDLIEARAAAKRIRELKDSGYSVGEGEKARPVEWEDIAVLLRAPAPVLHHYARAFEEQSIPWTAAGGGEFFDTTEVHVAMAYLQIVDNPHQDVPLLAVLRSPVSGFSADRLAMLRSQAKGDLYDALAAGAGRGEADCAAFVAELDLLRAQAGEKNSHQFLWYLYERTGMPGLFGAMDNGERRRANLMALYECARSYEHGGHKGLFGFLTHVARMVENGVSLGSLNRQERGVRIMSIHQSKGLEFPVVLLCGLSRQFNTSDQRTTILCHSKLGLGPKRTDRTRMIRYTTIAREAVALAGQKESRAEGMRLLYVAMTRAEYKLILFATVNGRMDKLSGMVGQASYPVHPQTLAGCRSPGAWLLLAALCRQDAGALHALAGRPPMQLLGEIGFPWDIRVLDGAAYQTPGAVSERLKPEEEAPAETEVIPGLAERLGWTYPHQAQVDLPSKLTATQVKGRTLDEEVAEYTERTSEQAARPLSRPRFAAEERGLTPAQKGGALHLVMQQLDLERSGSAGEVRAEVERLVAGGWLTPQQAETVNEEWIAAFWRSSLGREAKNASQLEREFKFSLLVPAERYFSQAEAGEEVLLQGVVDCWFRDADGGVTVVDFKTDRVTEESASARAAEYAPQLEAYAWALGQVLGCPVKRKLLWFFRPGRAVELP